MGKTVMLAYGSGSLKKSGVYDELKGTAHTGRQRSGRFLWHHAESHICQGAGRRKAGQRNEMSTSSLPQAAAA